MITLANVTQGEGWEYNKYQQPSFYQLPMDVRQVASRAALRQNSARRTTHQGYRTSGRVLQPNKTTLRVKISQKSTGIGVYTINQLFGAVSLSLINRNNGVTFSDFNTISFPYHHCLTMQNQPVPNNCTTSLLEKQNKISFLYATA